MGSQKRASSPLRYDNVCLVYIFLFLLELHGSLMLKIQLVVLETFDANLKMAN